MNYNDIIMLLKSNGYKITSQRKSIINALVLNNSNLVTADLLLTKTKDTNDKINITTIYRNLEILEKLNLLYKLNGDDGVSIYKLNCESQTHHHHIICQKCGRTEAIDFCPLDSLKELSNEKHFVLTDHKLELYGHCDKCQDKD